MRLIGKFETEKEAFKFYSFLLREGIQSIYEPFEEPTKEKRYRIWVCDEDDLEKALHWHELYQENSSDPRFQGPEKDSGAIPPSQDYAHISKQEDLKWQTVPPSQMRTLHLKVMLTHILIALCAILFLWNDLQEASLLRESGPLAPQLALTPLQHQLLFDNPPSAQYIETMVATVPMKEAKDLKALSPEAQALLKKADQSLEWKGIYPFLVSVKNEGWKAATNIVWMQKIRQGEVWRLLTPTFLHRDFLHILFNMAWLWILGKQIEERIRPLKFLLLVVMLGVLSNCAQYIAGGPYFLGFSGVAVGMAGFIWSRQKLAPWEGYPLQRATLIFLLFFVLAMLGLEIVAFSLHMFSIVELTPSVANTAHIVGGLGGILLGRFSLFSRGRL